MNTRVLFLALLGLTALSACNCGDKDPAPSDVRALAFTTQPVTAAAGVTLAHVQVTVKDGAGQPDPAPRTISLALAEHASGGVLDGTLSAQTVDGVATFSTLSIQKAASAYVLRAVAEGLDPVTSDPFDVTAAAPAQFTFTAQPTDVEAGSVLTPAPALKLTDAFANPIAGAAVSVALGENPGDATLSGTTTATTTAEGVVTFTGLSLQRAGSGYTLVASTSSVPPLSSQAFNVRAGEAAALEFFVQPPAEVSSGVAIEPAVTVLARDRHGNLIDRPLEVTLSLSGPSSGATLGGTLSATVTNGVATFSGISVDRAGTGYWLVASAAGTGGAFSTPFDVIQPSGLVYVDPPPGGKLRLVRSAASTADAIVLQLVAVEALTGYSVGFNLPLDTTRVAANATLLTPGTALPAGSSPAAAAAVIPTTGPLAGVLVTGQSQKAAGTAAVTTDSVVPAGAVLYTVRLDTAPGATPGLVFDGASLGPKFRARMRDKTGTDVVTASDFRIGTLRLY